MRKESHETKSKITKKRQPLTNSIDQEENITKQKNVYKKIIEKIISFSKFKREEKQIRSSIASDK